MSLRRQIPHQPPQLVNPTLKVVKTDVQPSGEAFQLVRPIARPDQTSDEIVHKLVRQYDYKNASDKNNEKDLQTVHAAFPNIANKIISNDGSKILADSNQDLIGDRYLAEQIKQINEENKKKSILDKWSHLLYEGEDERNYVSSYQPPALEQREIRPLKSSTFTLNNPSRTNF